MIKPARRPLKPGHRVHLSAPVFVSTPAPRSVRHIRRTLAVLTIAAYPGLGVRIGEHVKRQIAIALFAALIFARFEPLLDLLGLVSQLRHQIMWSAAVAHSRQTLANHAVD